MIDVEETVHIDRTPEEVFDYFCDAANDPDWNPYARSSRKTSDGPLGVGSTFVVDRKPSGPSTIRYVEYTRPSRWVIEGSGKPATFTFTAVLRPSGGGTDVTNRLQLEPNGAYRLMSPFMRASISRQLGKVNASLKGKLESRTP
jgi:uncharacterized protein YndB with AHSA1/START domain